MEGCLMFYYAFLDANNVVTGVYALPSQITADGYVEITADQYNDPTLVGKVYDPETNTFNEPTLWSCSTEQVQYKNTQTSLSTKLDEMEEAIASAGGTVDAYTKTESDAKYALADHTHTGYASTSHTHNATDVSGVVKTVNGTAPDENGNVAISVSGGGMTAGEVLDALKTVDGANSGLDADTLDGVEASGFATADHTHTGYATSEDLAGKANTSHNHAQSEIEGLTDALSGKADTNHTHTEYASASDLTAVQNGLNAKADTDHTHTGYATANHTHDNYITTSTYANGMSGKADTNHTHSGYATSSHTHSGYASSSHTHSDYLSNSGGTVNGNLNVAGILRVNGQQSVYDSGSMITLSTNNRETMIAGSKIYSKVTISVSSDERLKENIVDVDTEAMIDFVKGVDVKKFNYLGNDTECVGVIAQQLQSINAETAKYFVAEDGEGYLSVKATDLVFPLIIAVQELTKEVEALKQK